MPRCLAICAVLALAALALLAARPGDASAHPLGNFTINHYDRIDVSRDGVAVYAVLDMAEIPAFQERQSVDANGDGTIDDGERADYARAKALELAGGMRLSIDGKPAQLSVQSSEVSFPPGQGGLSLLRLTATFTAPLPDGWRARAPRLTFEDGYLGDRLGWREIVVRGGDGAAVRNANAPATSITDELTRYPADSLSSPLDEREASFSIAPEAGGAADQAPPTADVARAVRGNQDSPLARFAGLIAKDHLSAGVVIVSLLAAMAFGAIHALSPGHGKTVVGAYLVGSRGTLRHALLLALTVTVTHTSSVYLLGFATLYLSNYIVPERLYPWLGIASGALIIGMGLSLLFARLRASGLAGNAFDLLRRLVCAMRRKGVISGEAGALTLPAGDPTHHSGPHDRDDGDSGAHHHGPGRHAHAIPGLDGEPVSWRQLVGLGIFGGMLPCPSAIVVMLSAISLHRVGYGLVLIVAFSLGLAAVLTGIGFALVLTRRLASRFPIVGRLSLRLHQSGGPAGLLARAFPSASAMAVTFAGILILLRAISQRGSV